MEAIGISLSAATRGMRGGGGAGAGAGAGGRGGGCVGEEAEVGTAARRRIGRDVVRVWIDQGGGRKTLLEADVPEETPHEELCKSLRDAYQREGLPEVKRNSSPFSLPPGVASFLRSFPPHQALSVHFHPAFPLNSRPRAILKASMTILTLHGTVA